MNNQEVIKKFLRKENAQTNLRSIQNGYYTYKGRTLQTNYNRDKNTFELINYNTIIAYITADNELALNISKYSPTTSKIQGILNRLAKDTNYNISYYKGGE